MVTQLEERPATLLADSVIAVGTDQYLISNVLGDRDLIGRLLKPHGLSVEPEIYGQNVFWVVPDFQGKVNDALQNCPQLKLADERELAALFRSYGLGEGEVTPGMPRKGIVRKGRGP